MKTEKIVFPHRKKLRAGALRQHYTHSMLVIHVLYRYIFQTHCPREQKTEARYKKLTVGLFTPERQLSQP